MLNDFLIRNHFPEKYISNPLPPDWIPNKYPGNRTPETQKKWEEMEKKRLEREKEEAAKTINKPDPEKVSFSFQSDYSDFKGGYYDEF